MQVWALIGLVFHLRYSSLVRSTGQLPRRIWPVHLSDIAIGLMLGAAYVIWQTEAAQELHQKRQQPLVEALSDAPDHCAAFRQYFAEHPDAERPALYSGTHPERYQGLPQFVLAYDATANLEKLIVYYYSGSYKWKVTYKDNVAGMAEFNDYVATLPTCGIAREVGAVGAGAVLVFPPQGLAEVSA